MTRKITVLTLVKGRREALFNLIAGLQHNAYPLMELVVVHMNEDTYDLPFCSFPLRSYSCHSNESLPLAQARNFALSKAEAEHCIFLDVDCIPSSDFIQHYDTAFGLADQLWSGQVRYLHQGFSGTIADEAMHAESKADPIRAGLKVLPYELFWSLNFGCSKSVFHKIGGFDEKFKGYGAEDTDFAFAARSAGVPLGLLHAMAYHQHHPSFDPPLNHLQDIVSNANVFYRKWRQWPMEGWLSKFSALGLISRTAEEIYVTRIPAPEEIARYQKV